jgi:uncharacterized protein (UPF0335 family)
MASKVLEPISNVPRELFVGYVGKAIQLQKQMASLNGKLRAVFKVAKDDGVDTKAMKKIMADQKRDPAEVRREHQNYIAYATYLGQPIGTQLSIFDNGEPDISKMSIQQRVEKWTKDGYAVGAAGGDRSVNPHDPESEAGVAWFEGYAVAQGDLAKGFGKIEAKVHAYEMEAKAERVPQKSPAKGGDAPDPEVGGVAAKPDADTPAPRKRGRPPKERPAAPAAKAAKTPPRPPVGH